MLPPESPAAVLAILRDVLGQIGTIADRLAEDAAAGAALADRAGLLAQRIGLLAAREADRAAERYLADRDAAARLYTVERHHVEEFLWAAC